MVSKQSSRNPEVGVFDKGRGNRGRFCEGGGHLVEKSKPLVRARRGHSKWRRETGYSRIPSTQRKTLEWLMIYLRQQRTGRRRKQENYRKPSAPS